MRKQKPSENRLGWVDATIQGCNRVQPEFDTMSSPPLWSPTANKPGLIGQQTTLVIVSPNCLVASPSLDQSEVVGSCSWRCFFKLSSDMTIVSPLELKVQTAPEELFKLWLVCPPHVFPLNEPRFNIWMEPDRTRAAMFGSVDEKTTNDERSNNQIAVPVAVSQYWTSYPSSCAARDPCWPCYSRSIWWEGKRVVGWSSEPAGFCFDKNVLKNLSYSKKLEIIGEWELWM